MNLLAILSKITVEKIFCNTEAYSPAWLRFYHGFIFHIFNHSVNKITVNLFSHQTLHSPHYAASVTRLWDPSPRHSANKDNTAQFENITVDRWLQLTSSFVEWYKKVRKHKVALTGKIILRWQINMAWLQLTRIHLPVVKLIRKLSPCEVD